MKKNSYFSKSLAILIISGLIFILATCKKKGEEQVTNTPMNDTLVSASATIGAEGGQVALPDGSKLIIPANALSNSTTITLSKVKGAPIIGDAESEFIKLEPEGLLYNTPAHLQLPYHLNDTAQVKYISCFTTKNDSDELVNYVVDVQNKILNLEIRHHSWVTLIFGKPIYIAMHIPGKFLLKSDLLFCMAKTIIREFTWYPGHVGMYLGTKDPYSNSNDNYTIIESVPLSVQFGENGFNNFIENPEHLYLGARRPNKALSDLERTSIATYAINHLGTCYCGIGHSKWGCFSCVGLTELSYEFGGIDILSEEQERPFMLPFDQFMKTIPVDEITSKANEIVSIPVSSIAIRPLNFNQVYSADTSLSSLAVSGLPAGASFIDRKLLWIPGDNFIGQTITVNFHANTKGQNHTYTADQILKIYIVSGGSTIM